MWSFKKKVKDCKEALPATKLPPPPMPKVKPAKPYVGYTAEELRTMMVPREDLVFEALMETCKRAATQLGYSSVSYREDGFTQYPLASMQQRVFDRLVEKGLDCEMVKTTSRVGIHYHLVIRW